MEAVCSTFPTAIEAGPQMQFCILWILLGKCKHLYTDFKSHNI